MSFGSGLRTAATPSNTADTKNDVEVLAVCRGDCACVLSKGRRVQISSPPTDGIADIAWCPQADFLAAASWDGQVRIWEVQPASGASMGKAAYAHQGPVLSCAWSSVRCVCLCAGRCVPLADTLCRAMRNARTAPSWHLAAQTRRLCCTTCRRASTSRLERTMHPSRACDGMRAAARAFSSLAAGTSRSGTGTCAHQHPCAHWHCPSGATAWM